MQWSVTTFDRNQLKRSTCWWVKMGKQSLEESRSTLVSPRTLAIATVTDASTLSPLKKDKRWCKLLNIGCRLLKLDASKFLIKENIAKVDLRTTFRKVSFNVQTSNSSDQPSKFLVTKKEKTNKNLKWEQSDSAQLIESGSETFFNERFFPFFSFVLHRNVRSTNLRTNDDVLSRTKSVWTNQLSHSLRSLLPTNVPADVPSNVPTDVPSNVPAKMSPEGNSMKEMNANWIWVFSESFMTDGIFLFFLISLQRCKSRELRSSVLITNCECVKRNGLQLDCPKKECKGRPMCATKPIPICCPSKYMWRYTNVTMGKKSYAMPKKNCRAPKNGDCNPCALNWEKNIVIAKW